MARSKRKRTSQERFWVKVNKTDGCWLWIANQNKDGYGLFCVQKGVIRLAHRVSYEWARGPITDGLFVCHACDTPNCVRPDHLFLGTNADNMRDAYWKGRLLLRPGGLWKTMTPEQKEQHRAERRKTHCKHGHALVEGNLDVMKGRNGGKRVRCKTCRIEWQRAHPRKQVV